MGWVSLEKVGGWETGKDLRGGWPKLGQGVESVEEKQQDEVLGGEQARVVVEHLVVGVEQGQVVVVHDDP